ncbi:MAG TPA: thioesterase, partial [Arenibacter sp.]|nr:thioesterase [Arenibacter sp.]
MYLKEFEIRWSDVDANRHMANSAYLNFMSHTRMSFLLEIGFNQKTMSQNNIGPVVFHEHVYY